MALAALLGILIIAVIIGFVYYVNKISILSNRIDNSWAQIDVQLKKRADLVPNLVETVKGYMKHEKKAIELVTKSRQAVLKADAPSAKVKAGDVLSSALKTVFALAENYPNLKANENFMMLQGELAGIESQIAYARKSYNDSVLAYNNLITTLPGIWFAAYLGKSRKDYLETVETERKPVKVSFD